MSDNHPKPRTEADAELEREIRAGREYTLAEAIGRLAGPGSMKGASPVALQQQAVAEIQSYLNQHLADAAGALSCVLFRLVAGSEALLHGFNRPLGVLAECIGSALGSEYRLKELVRLTDVEWGHQFGERPIFEKDGCPPSADDPYTVVSVRAALTQLAGVLATQGYGGREAIL